MTTDSFIKENKEISSIPEIGSGFLPVWFLKEEKLFSVKTGEGVFVKNEIPLGKGGLSIPLLYSKSVTDEGVYKVKVVFKSVKKNKECLIFSSRRRLVFKNYVADKEEVEFLVDITPIIPRGQSDVDYTFNLSLAFFNIEVLDLFYEKVDNPRLFIAGDSTVCDQSADIPYSPYLVYAGWGQLLSFFMTSYAVSNHAHSGLTSESFRSEGHYDIMYERIHSGDYVLLQFGHNDQKISSLAPDTGYRENLKRYVEEIKEKMAIPVLITPLARNSYDAKGNYMDLLKPWSDEVLRLGIELDVQVIDLHAFSLHFFKTLGLEKAKAYFHPGDFTHLNDYGAFRMASYIASQLTVGTINLDKSWAIKKTSPLEVPKDLELPEELDGLKFFKDNLNNEEVLKRKDLFVFINEKLCFFPLNVYNDHYVDVLGHEIYAGAIETAYENGLIPEGFIAGNHFFPEKEVSKEEFLHCFFYALSSRKKLQYKDYLKNAKALGFLNDDEELDECCTKAFAAKVSLDVTL